MIRPTALVRRFRLFLALLGAAGVVTLAAAILYQAELDRPTRRSRSGPGVIRIVPGASLRSVTEDLSRAGWIRNPRLLAEWGRWRRIDQRILPGRYKLERGWTPRRVILEIGAGHVETARITIPEGWREEQVLDLLADSLGCDSSELRAAAADSSWVRGMGIASGRLEGYLFPETYFSRRSTIPGRRSSGWCARRIVASTPR